jgi:proline iminopeptidase
MALVKARLRLGSRFADGAGAFAVCLFLLMVGSAPSTFSQQTRGHKFNAPGATIYYEVIGSGSGTPLFVANGGPGFSHNYLTVSNVWNMLGQTRPVIMWDQRGTGQSGPLNKGQSCTLGDQISDLDALRAHLGFDKIDLLGHSWGGFLAMAYAAHHAGHIDRLILLDSPAPHFPDTVFLFSEIYPDIPESDYSAGPGSPAAAREAADSVYLSMLFYSPEHRRRFLERMAGEKRDFEIGDRLFKEMFDADLTADVKNFHFPVLVANGRFDANIAPVTAYKLHQAIPGSELVVFNKSGHMPFFEEPARFSKALNRFLQEPAGAGATK